MMLSVFQKKKQKKKLECICYVRINFAVDSKMMTCFKSKSRGLDNNCPDIGINSAIMMYSLHQWTQMEALW